MIMISQSTPKPEHITGESRRGGSRQAAGRGGADVSIRPRINRSRDPPEHRRQSFLATLRKHERRKSYVNRWRNTTSGGQAIYPLFIRETTNALRSWLLTNVPAPNFLRKLFSCQACPGIGCCSLCPQNYCLREEALPVESKTRTYLGRVGAGRLTAEWRGETRTGRTGRRRIGSPGIQLSLLPARQS